MIKRDILKEIYGNVISINKAYDIYDSIISSKYAPVIADMLQLTTTEWTAFGHGAGLDTIAHWRYKGWPSRCIHCKEKIDIENFGWLPIEIAGETQLRHIKCPAR